MFQDATVISQGRETHNESSGCSISTTFHKNCGRDESLRTTTFLKTVVGGKQGHAPCKILSLHEASFLCQSNLMDMIRLLTKMR